MTPVDVTLATHFISFVAMSGSQRGKIDNRGRHRVTSTESAMSHVTVTVQLGWGHTILVDFFSLPPPQYDAHRVVLITRLYADAQELFASTQARTCLSVCTRPLTACNDGFRGYQKMRRFDASRSFVTSEGYHACFRAGPGRGSCATAMRVICTINR